MPDRIINAPTLWPGLELFYHAFNELSTCRSVGMAEGPIPWTAVEAYCVTHAIIEEQRADMHYHIRKLDNAYLKQRAAKSAKDKPQPGAKK